jgi:glycerol-1-phosphate dehydrogenase [NAD(P)+]
VSSPHIEVVVADDALERLAAQRPPAWLVIADANTLAAAGARVAERLGAPTLVFDRRHGLHAGRDEVERVQAALSERPARPVAVGSGTITDIVRYAAHQADVEFVSVPTAASMDGYASSVAALELEGVKVTLAARAPLGIFADPRVAAAAPTEFTRAGVGDLLGKATARVDWLAAHLLYGEPYQPSAADRVLDALTAVLAAPEAALTGDTGAVARLLHGLIESGLAMSLVGSSRPASGFEHHASHFWDLLAARGLRAHHAHGLQVGYATRLAMVAQRFAFGGGVSDLQPPRAPEDPLGSEARRWLGDPGPRIAAAVQEKLRFSQATAAWPQTPAEWARVRAQLAPELDRFAAVDRALDAAGLPRRPADLDLGQEMLQATLRHATRLRARYTVIDFLEGQGKLDQVITAVLGDEPPPRT